MFNSGHLFAFCLLFVVMAGASFTFGAYAMCWAFGICAFCMAFASGLKYLNGN
jgi:hypothetical protein